LNENRVIFNYLKIFSFLSGFVYEVKASIKDVRKYWKGSKLTDLNARDRGSYMYKVIVFVNTEAKENLKEAMFKAGAGRIGDYDSCAFETEGIGQFRPLEQANPTIGSKNKLEKVQEVRIEMVVCDEKITHVLHAMKEAHPYEEPAYDVFKHADIDF